MAGRWTKDETEYLLAHYRTRRLKDIAADIGKSASATQHHFALLVRDGKADRRLRYRNVRWTEEDFRWARQKRDAGWTADEIVRALGRTRRAMNEARAIRRCGPKTSRVATGALTAEEVRRVLGSRSRRVLSWLCGGLLESTRVGKRGTGCMQWIITRAALIEFLGAHPERYDYDRIPRMLDGAPNRWLEYARRSDPARGYLTPKAAGNLLGYGKGRRAAHAVYRRIRAGILPAVHLEGVGISSHEWFIPRSAVMALVGRRAA